MSTIQLQTRLQNYSSLKIDWQAVLPIGENAWWVTLNPESESANGALEGKFFLPSEPTTRLVLFEPGFPGGASTDFERLHLTGLLSAGYAVFTARHRGTIINGEYSQYYINCPQRQEKAVLENQKVLGSGHSRLGDWLAEPVTAFDSLSSGFEEISLVGHSFGGLAVVSSAVTLFKRKSENIARIKKVVSLAGVGGRIRSADDHVLKRWNELFYADWARDRVEIGELAENIGHIRQAHELIHNVDGVIPETVQLICLSAYGDSAESVDEIISPLEALDVVVSWGKGKLVIDTTEYADAQAGKMAHELESLKTSVLLQLLDPAWNPSAQIIRLDDQGLR